MGAVRSGGEVVAVGEPGHVADLDQQPGGAGDAVLKPVVSTTDSEHVAELFTSLSPTHVVRVPRTVWTA